MDMQIERPFAVITGASYGIGLELARQFARNGYNLLIAGEDETIFEAQDELLEYGTQVDCIEVVLGTYHGVEHLNKAIKTFARPLEVLVICNQTDEDRSFIESKLKKEIQLINLNIISSIHLLKRLIPNFIDNQKGKILFVTNQSGHPVTQATNAFINRFAETIRLEVNQHNISLTILKLVPVNETESNSYLEESARLGFEGLMSFQETISTSNLKIKLQGWANSLAKKISEVGFSKH